MNLSITAQNNAIKTNYIRTKTNYMQKNYKCRLCGNRVETVYHIMSECSKPAQKDSRVDMTGWGKVIHWELRKRNGICTNQNLS